MKIKEQVEYEVVVGLEVHVRLLTLSKLFCGDSNAFGAEPNTQVSPVSLGHPGTLPMMNKKAIGYAIKLGLACQCSIVKENYFARKNYFYPDLPKGYQVTQHISPICKGGQLKINIAGDEKQIRLNRIHIEEDAGRSVHDADPDYTCIDYNRAGSPLVEIVTEPDLCSGEEAFYFLTELRKLIRYLEIGDGNMEEGSLRCDANISVRKKGEKELGTKVEIKNLNSIRFVKKAIGYESQRLTGILGKKGIITQETRAFDPVTETTFSIRDKEDADDYRYFAEPDLTPFHLDDEMIEQIRSEIPPLAEERVMKYILEWQLNEYDARQLTEEKSFSDYFEKIIALHHASPGNNEQGLRKATANWMIGPVRTWLNDKNAGIGSFPVPPENMAALIRLVQSGKLGFSVAAAKIFPKMLEQPGLDPEQIVSREQLFQQSGIEELESIIEKVLTQYADKVAEYKKGKKGLLSLFVGEVIKRSKGQANPKITNELLLKKLNAL